MWAFGAPGVGCECGSGTRFKRVRVGQRAVVEATVAYRTAMRDELLPRKALPRDMK